MCAKNIKRGCCSQALPGEIMSRGNPDNKHGSIDYLLGITILMLIGGLLYPPVQLLWPQRHLPLASSALIPVADEAGIRPGSALPFVYQENPFLLINVGRTRHAVSAICTYRESILRWDEDRQVLVCPAHGCTFDVRGNVLHGLAPRPLPTLNVVLSGGRIYAGG